MAGLTLSKVNVIFCFIVLTSIPTVEMLVQNIVQLDMYVEPSAVNAWSGGSGTTDLNQFREELRAVTSNLNDIYKRLEKDGINIAFDLKITFLDQNVLSGNYLDSNPALGEFLNYITPSYSSDKYDAAVLLTGLHFNRKFFGVASLGGICTLASAMVLSYRRGGSGDLLMAHEAGHLFNAQHDAHEYPDQKCYKRGGYVMEDKLSTFRTNRATFSPCSIYSIKSTIKRLNDENRNCLLDSSDIVTGPGLGALVTPDQLCYRHYNGEFDTFVNRTAFNANSNSDKVCQSYDCIGKTLNGVDISTTEVAAQGMVCGKNKVCENLKCVAAKTKDGISSDVDNSCLLGDQPKIGKNLDKTCQQLSPSECSKYKSECCVTCNLNGTKFADDMINKTADEVCRQRKKSNDWQMMRERYSTYGDNFCSELWCTKRSPGGHFEDDVEKAPTGLACGKNKRCFNGRCLYASNGDPNMPDICPYGDQNLPALAYPYYETCQYLAEEGRCARWGQMCCKSCEGKYRLN